MNNTWSIERFKLEHGAECYILNIKCIARETMEFLEGKQLWAQWFKGGGHSPHVRKETLWKIRMERSKEKISVTSRLFFFSCNFNESILMCVIKI